MERMVTQGKHDINLQGGTAPSGLNGSQTMMSHQDLELWLTNNFASEK